MQKGEKHFQIIQTVYVDVKISFSPKKNKFIKENKKKIKYVPNSEKIILEFLEDLNKISLLIIIKWSFIPFFIYLLILLLLIFVLINYSKTIIIFLSILVGCLFFCYLIYILSIKYIKKQIYEIKEKYIEKLFGLYVIKDKTPTYRLNRRKHKKNLRKIFFVLEPIYDKIEESIFYDHKLNK